MELPVRIRVRGIDHRAGRQDKGQRFQGVIGIELGAAGHAGGIIRHHAADGAGRLAGRVRAELAVAQPQTRIDLAHGCPWLHAHPLAVIEDFYAPEMLAHIHQVALAGGLAGQGGAARAQGHRNTLLPPRFEYGGHVFCRARFNHGLRGVEVVRGIGSIGHPVDDAGLYLRPILRK